MKLFQTIMLCFLVVMVVGCTQDFEIEQNQNLVNQTISDENKEEVIRSISENEVNGNEISLEENEIELNNLKENKEDQKMQAFYMVENWKEIYENAYGLGKSGNSIGGFTFQFSDGWWKFGQTKDLNIHNNNASWATGGYDLDYLKGSNNMNEEWFGICAKGPTDSKGFYTLKPRVAYYALQKAHELNPLKEGITVESISNHFNKINLNDLTINTDKTK